MGEKTDVADHVGSAGSCGYECGLQRIVGNEPKLNVSDD